MESEVTDVIHSPINVASVDLEEGEKKPLLGKRQPEPQPRTEAEGQGKWRLTKDKCKRLFVFVTLWTAFLFVCAAYSVIAPFYPQEV